jgi:hypothetical protein
MPSDRHTRTRMCSEGGLTPPRRPIALPPRRPGESAARYRRRRRDVMIALCSRYFSERYVAVGFTLSRARVREIVERLETSGPAQAGIFFPALAQPSRRDSRGKTLPTRAL